MKNKENEEIAETWLLHKLYWLNQQSSPIK